MKNKILLSAAFAAVACSAFAFTAPKHVMPKNDQFGGMGPVARIAMHEAGTRASGAIDFSYADELYSATYLNNTTGGKSRVYMCFQMSADDVKRYAGNKVTGFTVYSPSDYNVKKNPIANGRFFYSTDMKDATYSQDFTFSTSPLGEKQISLTTPYTITGNEKALTFGYSIVVPTDQDKNPAYYYPFDYIPTSYTGANMFSVSEDDTFPTNFQSVVSDFGALCMAIRIEGDKLPENIASIAEVNNPSYLPLSGNGATIELMVRNGAANPLKSVEITTSVTGMPDVVSTVNVNSLAYNATQEVKVSGIKGGSAGFSTLSMRITKVNGEDFDGKAVSANIPCYDNGYTTKIVAEDATGTWCGWCPGGIEALEYLKKHYSDRAIAIGAHYDDVMQIDGYSDFFKTYISGFPTILYNRSFSQTPTSPYNQVCSFIDAVASFFDFPAYANVELKGVTNEDKTACNMIAKTQFSINTTVPHYLSFIIVEDGLGPFQQSNYFGQAGVAMNGWEKQGSKVSTKFNDVARVYNKFPGIPNSIPSNIKANAVNEYSIELPLVSSTNAKLVKNDDYRVIALITNAENGRIVNATEVKMNKDNTGVKNVVNDSNISIEGGYGQVIVTGADNYNVYTLAGAKVANKNLPAGLYIVVANGQTAKVIVK